jgi:hypothetical protein
VTMGKFTANHNSGNLQQGDGNIQINQINNMRQVAFEVADALDRANYSTAQEQAEARELANQLKTEENPGFMKKLLKAAWDKFPEAAGSAAGAAAGAYAKQVLGIGPGTE